VIPVVFFLSVFGLYLSTLYPCIAPEDSGEFVTAAWTLGLPHASGYAPYVLLGKAACALLPFGNPAYRVNVLSAFLGAGGALLAADILRRLMPRTSLPVHVPAALEQERWKGLSVWLAALLWALVPGVWYLSLLAEVYVLAVFLGLLALWCAVRSTELESALSRRLFLARWNLGAFAAGIAVALHHTFVLWVPGLLAFLWTGRAEESAVRSASSPRPAWWSLPRLRTLARPMLAGAALFAAAGFSVQLFLLVRSQAAPLLDTGMPDGWASWWRVLARSDYGTFSLARDAAAGSIVAAWEHHLSALARAFTPAGIPLMLWGAWRMARKNRALLAAAVLLWVLPGPFFLALATPPATEHFLGVMERFYPLSFAGPLILLAWGMFDAGVRWPRLRAWAVWLVPLSLVAHLVVTGRGNLHARDFGANLLKSMPPGSVLWDPGDSAAYSVLYQQEVLRDRRDVANVVYHTTLWGQRRLALRHPDLTPGGRGDAETDFNPRFLADLVSGPRRQLVFTEVPASLPGADPRDGLPPSRYPEDALPFGAAYRYFPAGTYKLVNPSVQLPLSQWTFRWYRRSGPWRLTPPQAAAWARWPTPGRAAAEDPFTAEILRRYAEAYTNLGRKYAEFRVLDSAERAYVAALSVDPRQMEAYNNLGVLAFDERDAERALLMFRRASALDPANVSLHLHEGFAHRLAGRPEAAAGSFREAARLAPRDPRPLFHLADVLDSASRHAEALELWGRLLRMTPEDKDVYWRLARTHKSMGRDDKALEALSEYFLLPLTDEEKAAAETFRSTLSASPS
jgi:tetratricopeptide (TPR) repeat protein